MNPGPSGAVQDAAWAGHRPAPPDRTPRRLVLHCPGSGPIGRPKEVPMLPTASTTRSAAHRGAAPLSALLLVTGTLLAFPGAARAAAGDNLVGKWQAEAMEVEGKRYPVKAPMRIVFEFQRGGKFIATMSYKSNTKAHEGTWAVTGAKLTMTADGKTEVMSYKITGGSLRMEKRQAGKTMIHHMKRLR